jgi:GAF domain-containing protein
VHVVDDAELELAATFSEVARVLLAESDEVATLDKICQLAVATIDGCELAGISLLHKGLVESRGSTDDVPRRLDEIQSETQEGPCADAIREHEVFLTGDLRSEERWSAFSRRAHDETGVTSVLALRLYADEDTMGALNLYSTARDAFDDHDIAVAAVFASHAAVAMHDSRSRADLEARADTRDVIGMAKGLLMAHEGISPEEAFDILRRASQRTNVKLRTIAGDVVAQNRPPD